MVVKREFVPTKSAAAVDSLGRYLVFGGVLEIERLDSLARRVNLETAVVSRSRG
jgi:hypothetical protein